MWGVVEEHLEEAEYLFRRWRDALEAPDFTPRKAARFEKRLLPQLDGLADACPEAVGRLLEPALEAGDASRAQAAALAILHSGMPEAVGVLVEGLRSAETPEPLSRALCLSPRPVESALGPLLSSPTALHRAWALDIEAFRQAPVSEWLTPFLAAEEPVVAAAALRLARFSTEVARRWIHRGLGAQDSGLRDAAIEAGLLGGMRSAWAMAQRAVDERRLRFDLPLFVLAMSGEPEDAERLAGLLKDELERGAALFALGFSGWSRAVDLCLPFLGDADVGPLAGEVVTAITGLELKDGFCQPPAEPEEELTADEEDRDVAPVAGLPVPNPEAVQRWWAENRHRLEPQRRYLNGRVLSPESLVDALAHGPMRRRHMLALEASVQSGGRFRLETRAWLRAQRLGMPMIASATLGHSLTPFSELLKQ